MAEAPENSEFNCLICGAHMVAHGTHLICVDDALHRVSLDLYNAYKDGHITVGTLRHRMLIQRGKLVRGK